MGYGVIGSPTDSGSVSLGSSPGTPAPSQDRTAPSSRGPGRRPLKAVAPVRIRSGLHPWHPSAHPSGVSRGDFALSCPARTPAASGGDPRPLDRPPFGRPWAGHPSGGGQAPFGGGRATLRAAARPRSVVGRATLRAAAGPRSVVGRGRPSGGGGASLRVGGRASFGRGAGQPSGGGGASLRGGGQAPSRGGRAGIRGGREWWALGGVDVGEAFGGRIGRSGSGFPYRRHRTGATGGFGVRVRAC